MPDGFNLSGTQTALHLSGALDDVSRHASGADMLSRESNAATQAMADQNHAPLANSLKLTSHDFKKLSVGDLVELKQSGGGTKFGLVKSKQRHGAIVELTPISTAQASTIRHNFPHTHYLVLNTFMPAQHSAQSWFDWDFSKLETLIATFTDYFLALVEKIIGKQASRLELESKALACIVVSCVLLTLAFWAFTLWQQF